MRARYYNAENSGRFINRDPIWQNDQVNLYTYVANSPLKYTDRDGRKSKTLIIIGIDEDWQEPEFDKNGFMIVKLSTDPKNKKQWYIALQYNRLKRMNPKFEYRVVRNYQAFDDAVNEKQRDKIMLIAHGFRSKIALNGSLINKDKSTELSYRNMNSDTQTEEQKNRLSKTELELYSCDTGKYKFGSFSDSIAQNIQDHYQFKNTRAPTTTIRSDWSMLDEGRFWDTEGEWKDFN